MSQSILEKIPGLSGIREKQQDEKLAKWVEEIQSRSKNARAVVERSWYLNMAFYEGRQNVMYVRSSTSATNYALHVPLAPKWRVRLVVNKVRGIVRKEIAKTTSQKPIFTVVPETTEEEDINAARAAEAIFLAAYTGKELQTVIQQSAWWRSVCGNGFIKTWWDPNVIDIASNQQGDICIERIRPFNIFVPDLMEEDIEKQPWVIHAWTMPPEDAQRVYRMDKLPDANTTSTNNLMEDSFLNIVGGNNNTNKETMVLEVWIKPNKHPNFPDGALITVVGGEVAQKIPQYPYAHGEYPFAKLDHVPTGRFYSASVVSDLIALQREYNRTRSQLIENKNLMGRPRFLAPKGSIQANRVSGEPGQVIEYELGLNPPTEMPMPQMPAYVMEEINTLQNDMDDISSQHEISRGSNPTQVTAATAISFLQEQDDSNLALTIESQEKAIRKIGRQYLGLVHQYWNQERIVRVVGEDGYFDAQMFTGSAIKGTKINRDVRVEAGSALSTSKAARQALIMDLMKNGMIDPQIGLQRLEMGGVEKLYDELTKDQRQAQRENMRLAMGQGIIPNSWDNHQIHTLVHNSYRKTQQFELLPDEIKALFEAHVEIHSQALMGAAIADTPATGEGVDGQPPVGNNGGTAAPTQ